MSPNESQREMVWANFASKWFFFFFFKKNEKKSWAWKPLLCSCYHSNVSLRNPSRSLGCKGPFRLLSHAYCSRNCNCSASVCIEGREQRKIFAWEIEITIVLRSKERVKYFRILAKFSRIPSLVFRNFYRLLLDWFSHDAVIRN